METKNKKKDVVWHILGAVLSVVFFMGLYAFNGNIVVAVALSLISLAYALFLNNAKGMKRSIIKTTLIFVVIAIIVLGLTLLSDPAQDLENIINCFAFSFILLPGISFFINVLFLSSLALGNW